MFRELKPLEWEDALNAGLEYRYIYGKEQFWHRNEQMFYNTHPTLAAVSAPNIIMATGDSLLSRLVVKRPSPIILARSEEAVSRVRILETLDKDFTTDLKIRQAVEDAVLSSFLFGVGFLKYGYDSEFGFSPKFDALGGQAGFTLTQFNRKGFRNEFNDAEPGMPWVSSVSPQDIVVPWGTRKLEDAPWIAHRVIRHIEDVKSDPKYNARKLEPTISMKDHVDSYKARNRAKTLGDISTPSSGVFGEIKREFVEIWEIHDRRFQKVYAIVPSHTTFIRNELDLLQTEGLPFGSVSFIPKARNFWVTPDADYLMNPQAELIDISLQMGKQRRASVLKFLYGEDAIDPVEVEAALSPDVGLGIRVKGGHNLDEAIKPFTAFNNNNQLTFEAENVRRDAREVVGFSRNQAGEFERGRTTATEALVVNEASGDRIDRRSLSVIDLYIRTYMVINSFVFEFWTLPKAIQTLDLTNVAQWINFIGADLKGNYSYEILFSDSPTPTTESRKAEAIQIYTVMIQDPTVDQVALRRYLARAFNDPEFTSIFNKELLADANIQLLLQVLQQIQGGTNDVSGNGGVPAGVRPVSSGNGSRVAAQGPNPG
ncbi:hypothetical protein LCGC14_1897510, partial [marine sediment metagenome]